MWSRGPAAAKITAVYFDAGLTLIGPRKDIPELCAEAATNLGYAVSPEQVRREMASADVLYRELIRADPDIWSKESSIREMWRTYYSLIFRRLGLNGAVTEAAEAVYEAFNTAEQWSVFLDVWPTLEGLRAKGLRIGVISDWGPRLVDSLLEPLGLTPYFDTVVVSARVGVAKPSSDLYRLATSRMGVVPQEVVHVGDSYVHDVLGARSAGMNAILLDRAGRTVGLELDCARIYTLTQVLEWVT